MQTLGAVALANFAEPGAQRLVSWGTLKERLPQCAQIKARAADQKHTTTAHFYLFNLFNRRPGPVSRRKIDERGNEIN